MRSSTERRAASADRYAPRAVLHVLLIIVGVAVGLWALHKLASVVLVVILAALFAYVIAPLVELAGRPVRIGGRLRRLSRAGAIAVVYVLIAGGVSGGAALLLPSAIEQSNDMIVRAPAYAQSILTWEGGWSRYYAQVGIPIELRQSIDRSVLATGEAGVESIRGSLLALMSALSYLPWLVLIPILAFFLLKDATSFRHALVEGAAAPSSVARPPVGRGAQHDAGGVYSRAITRVHPGR
jgi:predicted PurR-regulated permease PerM